MVKRLFPWLGSKARLAPRLPAPSYDLIVEPFCGSAAYSLLHGENRDVIIRDADEALISMWKWLVKVSLDEFLSLPTYGEYAHVSEVENTHGAPAAFFVKLWNNSGGSLSNSYPTPHILRSAAEHPGSYWDALGKMRLAEALRIIRHWKVELGDYSTSKNAKGTWFVDPPYCSTFNNYGIGGLDYDDLRNWVIRRKGEVIVTERQPAKWLPFEKLGQPTKSTAFKFGDSTDRKRTELLFWGVE